MEDESDRRRAASPKGKTGDKKRPLPLGPAVSPKVETKRETARPP